MPECEPDDPRLHDPPVTGGPPSDRHEKLEQQTYWEARALKLSGELERLLRSHLAPLEVRHVPSPVQLAEAVYRFRRQRERLLAELGLPQLFGEPAWDMLLDLYLARANGQSISISSLSIAGCVPGTTGLRWIALLADNGLVSRRPDVQDGRRSLIEITDMGFDYLNQLFTLMQR